MSARSGEDSDSRARSRGHQGAWGMRSTGDSLGDYRARAAACRAMAEKAAEFPSETRTWIQIAEMWEGLAERAEAQPAVGTDEVPVPENADGNATELGAA